ncbi:hypothetical protein JB92DRAFT_3095290 [Gautieria morchelliformis]|nr:hypothetical protein JB92DRAFT_3113289 [Gautieria morchelliformis]KAF8517777.1 hypothetical protein JB92DRAFT_3095290 [Gautieria morchelliformis]
MTTYTEVFKATKDKESLRQLQSILCAANESQTTPTANAFTFVQIQQSGMAKYLKAALNIMCIIRRLNGTLERRMLETLRCIENIGWPLFNESGEFNKTLAVYTSAQPQAQAVDWYYTQYRSLKANKKTAVVESLLDLNREVTSEDWLRMSSGK